MNGAVELEAAAVLLVPDCALGGFCLRVNSIRTSLQEIESIPTLSTWTQAGAMCSAVEDRRCEQL